MSQFLGYKLCTLKFHGLYLLGWRGIYKRARWGRGGGTVEFYGISKMYPTLVAKENFRPKKKDVLIANGDVACNIIDIVIVVIHSFSISKTKLHKTSQFKSSSWFSPRHRSVKQFIYQFLKMAFIFTQFILQATWMHIFAEFGFCFRKCPIIDTRDFVRLMY